MSVLRRESDCIIGPTSKTRREPSSSDADERGMWPMGQHGLSTAACVSVTAYRASAFCWPPFSISNLFVFRRWIAGKVKLWWTLKLDDGSVCITTFCNMIENHICVSAVLNDYVYARRKRWRTSCIILLVYLHCSYLSSKHWGSASLLKAANTRLKHEFDTEME